MILKILSIIVFINLLSELKFTHTELKFGVQDSDTIVWSGKNKLSWKDFSGVPDDPKVYVKASTASGIYMTRFGGIRNYHYTVKSFFIKSKSWTKVKDDYNLKHEQLHFDISELFARKLRKSIDSLNKIGIKDKIVFKNKYKNVYLKMNNYQDKYDNEVYFNEIKQKEWINKIASELISLKEYELEE